MAIGRQPTAKPTTSTAAPSSKRKNRGNMNKLIMVSLLVLVGCQTPAVMTPSQEVVAPDATAKTYCVSAPNSMFCWRTITSPHGERKVEFIQK